jgi:hypothetical protein
LELAGTFLLLLLLPAHFDSGAKYNSKQTVI